MVGCKIYVRSKRDWLSTLLCSRFFGSCVDHRELRKNEKNVFCIDCGLCCCRHCISSSSTHWLHRHLQICKYVYQDVIRFQDLHKHLDCSKIQTYKINGEKAVHLKPRPQSKDFKPPKSKAGTTCEACGRFIQDLPNRFCSIACKVSIVALESSDKSHKIIPLPPEFSGLYLKENYNSDENMKEQESSISTGSSEEETRAFANCALRPKKHLHKRKGIPRRAPLC